MKAKKVIKRKTTSSEKYVPYYYNIIENDEIVDDFFEEIYLIVSPTENRMDEITDKEIIMLFNNEGLTEMTMGVFVPDRDIRPEGFTVEQLKELMNKFKFKESKSLSLDK